jgi:hypothetical protein
MATAVAGLNDLWVWLQIFHCSWAVEKMKMEAAAEAVRSG